jgi:DUF1365 family protein
MHSCIYAGSVRHRRFEPVTNEFRYGMFMLYVDLAELDHLFDGYWLWSARRPAIGWFRRRDHYGDPAQRLDESIRGLVERETGSRPDGPVRLLTHLRYFGYCFNPVSFYYCFDANGEIRDVVMEVNNTPWGEMHCYVLPRRADGRAAMRFDFDKAFHVSPFLPMDMRYRSRLTPPGEKLFVGIENWREGRRVFDAHLALDREPITHANLARHLAIDPLATGRVIMLIMWQALKLWIKRTPYHSKPDASTRPGSTTS